MVTGPGIFAELTWYTQMRAIHQEHRLHVESTCTGESLSIELKGGPHGD